MNCQQKTANFEDKKYLVYYNYGNLICLIFQGEGFVVIIPSSSIRISR